MNFNNNNFYTNNQITPVLGGELHYFRLPKDQWLDRILKMKKAGFTMISTYVPWMIHEAVEGEIDFDGSTFENCDLISFLSMAHKQEMKVLLRPGPYVMSELVGSGIPKWLLENYPTVRALDHFANVHPVPELVCIHEDVYLSKVKIWYDALALTIKPFCDNDTISMIQLDNEVGMFNWVTHCPDMHSVMLSKFRKFLKDDELFEVVSKLADQDLRNAIMNPQTISEGKLLTNYKYFERQYIFEYLKILQEMLTSHQIEKLNCINVHGFTQHDYAKRGTKYPIGLSQLKECASLKNSVLAGDYYLGNIVYENVGDLLVVNALTKSIQDEKQPLFSAEFQSGFQNSTPKLLASTHDLKARLCFSQGMNAINYYMFCGGYNYRQTGLISNHHDWQAPISKDGELRSSFYLLEKFNEVISAYKEQYLLSQQDTQASLLYSLDEYLTPYSHLNDQSVHEQQQKIETLLFEGVGKYCTYQNISLDAIDLASTRKIKHSSAILVCSGKMNLSAQLRVIDYLEQGNNLLIYGTLPTHDFYGNECTSLLKYLELEPKIVENYQSVQIFDEQQLKSEGMVSYELSLDYQVIGKNNHNDPVAFYKQQNNSNICILCATIDMGFDYVQNVFKKMLNIVNINSDYQVDDLLFCSSRSYKETRFLAITNVLDETFVTKVIKNDINLFNQNKICVPPRTSLLLPLNYELLNGTILEYATQELCHHSYQNGKLILKFNLKSKNLVYKLSNQTEVVIDNVDSDTYTVEV